MAGESWLGGQITGERPSRGTTGGGYVPLGDVPNAPKTVDMPMIGNYPAMFTQKLTYADRAPDMKGRAADLMQPDLPSSFEEAGNIRAAAAGRGQAAMGKAIAGAGEDIGNALGALGHTLSVVRGKVLDAEDDKQMAQFNTLDHDYKTQRQGIMDANPPEKWPALIEKLNEEFKQSYAGLGVRPETKAKIEMAGNSSVKTTGVTLEIGQYQYLTKQQNATGQKLIENGRELIQAGDFAAGSRMADEGVGILESNGTYDKELAAAERQKTVFVAGNVAVRESMETPEGAMAVLKEAEAVRKGGKSENFPVLNSNPALAPNLEYEAQEKVKAFKRDQYNEIGSKINSGEIKDMTGLKAELKKSGSLLDENVAKSLEQAFMEGNTPMIAGHHVDARKKINEFDPNSDKTGNEYVNIRTFIDTAIDKPSRARFINMLDNKRDATPEKSHSAQANESALEHKRTDRDNELGLLVDPKDRELLQSARQHQKEYNNAKSEGERKAALEKITPEMAAAVKRNDERVLARKNLIDDYIEKNPDFKPGDLQKAVDEADPTSAHNRERNAGEAAGPTVRRATSPGSPLLRPPTKDEFKAAAGNMPLGMGITGMPRDIRKASNSPAWQEAFVSPGERSDMIVTAFTPGKGDPLMEGKNEVKGREGPAFTYEKYEKGLVPWVSVAMDPKSEWQGQFVISTAFPGVVFKVEDIGSAFRRKGEGAIDVAFDRAEMATDYKGQGTWKVITQQEAARINGGQGVATQATGPVNVVNAVDPSLPAMGRPRTSAITKIVVHGDVLTDVNKLISVQKNDDRGYHYYIGTDGSVSMVVPPDRIAYHIKGENSDSIGIVIAGADNGRMPTPAQDQAAKQLISQLARQYGIKQQNVAGHGERQPNRRHALEGGHVAKDIREKGFI